MADRSDTGFAAGGGLKAGEADGRPLVGLLRSPRVAIIGAGMSGIGMAANLRLAGIESFRIYEKWDDLGGTWQIFTVSETQMDFVLGLMQMDFARGLIEMWRQSDVDAMWPTLEAKEQFNVELRAAVPNTIRASG
jgi:cation diffusion facilitator CzcD-associated flavoprotein CzcO